MQYTLLRVEKMEGSCGEADDEQASQQTPTSPRIELSDEDDDDPLWSFSAPSPPSSSSPTPSATPSSSAVLRKRSLRAQEELAGVGEDARHVAALVLDALPKNDYYEQLRPVLLGVLAQGLQDKYGGDFVRGLRAWVSNFLNRPAPGKRRCIVSSKKRKTERMTSAESAECFLARMAATGIVDLRRARASSLLAHISQDEGRGDENEDGGQEEEEVDKVDISSLGHDSPAMIDVLTRDWARYEAASAGRLLAALRLGRDIQHIYDGFLATNNNRKPAAQQKLLSFLKRHGVDLAPRTVQQKRQLWSCLGAYPLLCYLNIKEQELARQSHNIAYYLETYERPSDLPEDELTPPEFWSLSYAEYCRRYRPQPQN